MTEEQQKYEEEIQLLPDPPSGLSSGRRKITEDSPLLPIEQKFVTEYLKTGNCTQAAMNLGVERKSYSAYASLGYKLLHQPNVQKEFSRIMEELKNETVASAKEVMQYLTSVMRGEVKDQFGLDAPLSERTKAAQELAKRTIDIENREAGKADSLVSITLDWGRD